MASSSVGEAMPKWLIRSNFMKSSDATFYFSSCPGAPKL
jgi:hypothetical protein